MLENDVYNVVKIQIKTAAVKEPKQNVIVTINFKYLQSDANWYEIHDSIAILLQSGTSSVIPNSNQDFEDMRTKK